MATVEINKWFADAFGIDPNRSASRLSAWADGGAAAPDKSVAPADDEADQSVETDEAWLNSSVDPGPGAPEGVLDAGALAAAEPKQGGDKGANKGSVPVGAKRLEIEVPALAVLDGCFEAKFSCFVGISGTVQTIAPKSAETTTLTPIGYEEGALVAKAAQTWADEEGVEFFGWPTVFSEVEFEGAMEVKDGIKVKVSAAGTFACGAKVKFEAMLFSYDTKSEMKLLEISFGVGFPATTYDVQMLDLSPAAEVRVKLEPTLGLVMEPNWPRIWTRVAEEVGKDVALGARAQSAARTALSGVNVDIAIASGFLAIGAVAIAASFSAIDAIGDAAEAPQQCAKLTDALLEGYKMGVLGSSAPTLELMQVGYYEGIKGRNEAVAKLKARFPYITDTQVRDVLDTVADRLVEGARPNLEQKAKVDVWRNFARTHQDNWWAGIQETRRLNAWRNIFGHDPKKNDTLWLHPLE